jgi:hypothetical protein
LYRAGVSAAFSTVSHKQETAMATRVQISCINKADRQNPHERIQNIGGVRADGVHWKRSQQQAVIDIESGTYAYYVSAAGRTVDVIVATHNGNKYIKTTADGVHPDNLLALADCR